LPGDHAGQPGGRLPRRQRRRVRPGLSHWQLLECRDLHLARRADRRRCGGYVCFTVQIAPDAVAGQTARIRLKATSHGGGVCHPQSNFSCTSQAHVCVLAVDIKKVEFTSDHGVLTDHNADYAGSGGTVYNPRGWIKGGANNPITHVKDSKMTANVTLRVQPSGISFDLTGDGPISALDFHKTGVTATGSDQTVSVTSDDKIPAQVDVLEESVSWSVAINNGECLRDGGSSGPHKIYVTWGSPGPGPTLKRINKVCTTASSQSTPEGMADSLHDMVASETTFGSGDVAGWALLDGGSGDCDNQARCMMYTFEMLGAGAANERRVRASSNAGEGNCLDLESRVVNGQTHYLVMDFNPGLAMIGTPGKAAARRPPITTRSRPRRRKITTTIC
jgi:hypothetical protein